jgi:hypothetical protein
MTGADDDLTESAQETAAIFADAHGFFPRMIEAVGLAFLQHILSGNRFVIAVKSGKDRNFQYSSAMGTRDRSAAIIKAAGKCPATSGTNHSPLIEA